MAKENMQVRDEVEIIVKDRYGRVKKKFRVSKSKKVW